MVKSVYKKEESDISTSHSLWVESEDQPPETLGHIIQQVPRLTQLQRRQGFRNTHSTQSTSRKWSQAETCSFYQSLRHYGLDFTLISFCPAFMHRRSHKELSNKYKKEAKRNPLIIDGILNQIDEDGLFSCRGNGQTV